MWLLVRLVGMGVSSADGGVAGLVAGLDDEAEVVFSRIDRCEEDRNARLVLGVNCWVM